jgi:hypothetical protein
MRVYRAPMRSRLDDVPHAPAVERALRLGVCGVGGRLPRPPASLDDAVRATYDAHGERVAARLSRFAAAPVGSPVWTRSGDGLLHVGTLDGEWRWDGDDEAWSLDLQHVRDCAWQAPDDVVPGAVLATFARGGRNFQEIRALRRPPGASPATG